MTADGFGSTILLVAIVLLVIFAAYFTTRFLSVKTKGMNGNKYMRIKDRMMVGRDKHILLLEVGGRIYLIGVTNQSVNVLGSLDQSELEAITEEPENASVISVHVKDVIGRAVGVLGQFKNADQMLKVPWKSKKAEPGPEIRTEEDDIEKILEEIKQRKSRLKNKTDSEGDR